MQYLLTLPLMVLAFKNNNQAAVTVPAATCIDAVGSGENDDRFALISVDHAQFHIFASELADRAIPVAARQQMPRFTGLSDDQMAW